MEGVGAHTHTGRGWPGRDGESPLDRANAAAARDGSPLDRPCQLRGEGQTQDGPGRWGTVSRS